MAVQHNSPSTKADASSSTRPISASVSSVTGGLVRNSVLGLPWDTVSTAPCNVKQGLTNEDDRLSGECGARRDKGAIFLDANKDLMKKGIIELDSSVHGQLPVLSSALQPSQSSPSDRSPSPFQIKHECNVNSGEVQIGVLVAGAGRSMRILENSESPNSRLRPVRHEQASYPDSDTPDTLRTGDGMISVPLALSPRASDSDSLEGGVGAAFSDCGTLLSELVPVHSEHHSDARHLSTLDMLSPSQSDEAHRTSCSKYSRELQDQMICTSSHINMQGEKKLRRHSLTQPSVGHSTSCSAKDYFQVSDELSQENSHFTLSEALLTVVEQYKADTVEVLQEAMRGERESGEYVERTDVATSIYTTDMPFSSRSDDGPTLPKVPKISLLELMQCCTNLHSAESTAQRLLRFIATQYSVGDTEDRINTQTVLTLPVDFLSSLKQNVDLQSSIAKSTVSTRGNKDWAPPRAQIIFHIKHPSRNVMKQLASQEYRCTGCGMKQDPAQARYFRFCNYTGKYFCQKCHTNATSVIPAYIMDRWSFKRYYVSNFAHDLLERIHYEPVFDVQNVNPQIYSMVPILAQARDLRTQLVAVKKYLRSCRQAQSLTATFDGYIPWTADIHTYSIDDFQQVKLKLRYLKSLLSDSIKHIKSCPLCQGKGFVCEFCFNPEIIFPFELNKVSVCQYCQCCFHKHCFGNQPCPRCIRIRQRERRRQTNYADED